MRTSSIGLAVILVGCAATGATDAGSALDADVVDAASVRDAASAEDAPTMADASSFDAWTSCDWVDGPNDCLCTAVTSCDAVGGGTWTALGSSAMRTCARRGDTCDVAYFTETEGGAAAYRCSIAIGACSVDVARDCEQVLTCNLVMGDCPPEIVPTNVIPCALAFP